MAQSHTTSIKLIYGKNTNAFYSLRKPSSLIIFVHGFGGDTLTTFNNFHDLIPATNNFENSDFIFYGYDSLKSQAEYHAAQFYKFIKAVSVPKQNKRNKEREIENDFEYERIIVVAHSLGSLLARRALITGYGQNDNWVSSCRLVLFAPAHSGARIQKLAMQSLPGIKKVFGGLAMFFWPILDDLQPESATIVRLRNDTSQIMNSSNNIIGKAFSVFIGENDLIVHNIPFIVNDPASTTIPGKGHKNICKPLEGIYMQPITELISAL